MQYASENLIPVTLELGGKSPNIFFADVMEADDDFFDKALEGFTMFALNQGEVCTCPSRALVQESIYDRFMERAIARVKQIVEGNPLDPATMIGAQASNDQLEKILSYIDIGQKEGAKVLTGGARRVHAGELKDGYYVQPTIFEGTTRCASSRRRSSGRCVSVTKFKDFDDALSHRQRHAVRARRRRVEPRRQHLLSHGPRASRRAGCGPTATTSIPRTRRSAATSSRASGARTTR